MPRQVEQSTSARALPSARLQPAGVGKFRAALWTTRLTMVALALSAGWMLLSALRPLPSPDEDALLAPPVLPTEADIELTLDQREAILDQLASNGNIFAPDRKPWKISTASRRNGSSSAAGNSPDTVDAQIATAPSATNPTAVGANAVRYEDIPVEKKPAIGVSKELKDLQLRGVYRIDGVSVAMIGAVHQANRAHAEPRRVGDTFGKVSWKVVAIDDLGKRVILSLANVNVELRMYDDDNILAQVGARDRPSAVLPRNPSVVVHTRTLEQIRSDLVQAGLSNAEIDAVMSLSANPALAAQPTLTPAQVNQSLGSAPPGIAELLKMMASDTAPGGSAPTLPQIRPTQNTAPPQTPSPAGGG